jgi:large subunit ribosomal protein L17
MRHQKQGKKFGRNTNQRKALLRNLIESLIIHEEIKTTESKAKTLKQLVDKLITKAKIGSLHVRRQILSFLPNKKAVNKLVEEIAPRFKQRTSGFTRFIRLGNRRGDNAMMVKMELVEKKSKNVPKVPKVSEVSKVDKGKVK